MELTKNEKDLAIFALSQLFDQTHIKLQGTNLGDIERKRLEETKQESSELMNKLNS